jgi:hypothetical protein
MHIVGQTETFRHRAVAAVPLQLEAIRARWDLQMAVSENAHFWSFGLWPSHCSSSTGRSNSGQALSIANPSY